MNDTVETQLQNEQDLTFAERTGTPEMANKIKLARKKKDQDKATAEKKETFSKTLYSKSGSKILKYEVHPNGVYSTFIGRLKGKHQANGHSREGEDSVRAHDNDQMLKTKISVWRKQGLWLGEEDAKEKLSAVREELALKFEAFELAEKNR